MTGREPHTSAQTSVT